MNFGFKIFGINTDFEKLFFSNESKALIGKKKKALVALVLILLVTFISLGYAVGTVKNLEVKMNDPFINWINLGISENSDRAIVPKIYKDFSVASTKEHFLLNEIEHFPRFALNMFEQSFDPAITEVESLKNFSFSTWGRPIKGDDVLLERIFTPKNLIWKNLNNNESNELNCDEIVISEEMMRRLGYDPLDIEIGYLFIEVSDRPTRIKINAVVRELPMKCDFISSNQLCNIKNVEEINGFECQDLLVENDNNGNNFKLIGTSDVNVEGLKEALSEFFQISNKNNLSLSINKIKSGKNNWSVLNIAIPFQNVPSDDIGFIGDLIKYLKSKEIYVGDINEIENHLEECRTISIADANYLAFNFSRLDSVKAFKKDLKERYDVDIDMLQVENKDNFATVSRLTFIVSIVLLGFSLLSIILFINNLLKSHLYKVRSNLGTFKAFGLDDKFLKNTYLKIILSFVLAAILIAFSGVFIIDLIEGFYTKEESKFTIFNYWVLGSIVGLILFSLYTSSITVKKILGDTPGNMIYNR